MEFRQAMQNLVHFSDRIKDLDREIVRLDVEGQQLLTQSVENGLIPFEKANIIDEQLAKIKQLRGEIVDAEKSVKEAREYLFEHLQPFEGYRVVFEYVSEKGQKRACQVFVEEDEVRFI